MRRTTPTAVLLVVLALLATTSPGCQTLQDQNARDHVATARSVYIMAVETMTTLGEAGLLKLDDAERFEVVRVKAAAVLAAADEAVAEGKEIDFSDLRASMETLQTLVVVIARGVR